MTIKQIQFYLYYLFYKRRLKKHITNKTFFNRKKDILTWLADHHILILLKGPERLIVQINQSDIYDIVENRDEKTKDRYPFFVSSKYSISLMDKKIKWIPVKFESVHGSFNVSYNQLTSLEFMPQYIGQDCAIHHNQFSNLEFISEKIDRKLFAEHNPIQSLLYFPQHVGSSVCMHYHGKYQENLFDFWFHIHQEEQAIQNNINIVQYLELPLDMVDKKKKLKKL